MKVRACLMKIGKNIMKQAKTHLKQMNESGQLFTSALFKENKQKRLKKGVGFSIKTNISEDLVLAQQINNSFALNEYRRRLGNYIAQETNEKTHTNLDLANLFCKSIDAVNKVHNHHLDTKEFESNVDNLHRLVKKAVVLNSAQMDTPVELVYDLKNEAKIWIEHFYENAEHMVLDHESKSLQYEKK